MVGRGQPRPWLIGHRLARILGIEEGLAWLWSRYAEERRDRPALRWPLRDLDGNETLLQSGGRYNPWSCDTYDEMAHYLACVPRS